MNVKRILVITVIALVACLAFTGAASAFTISQEATSNPSGALVPGQDVTSNMRILYYNGDMGVGGRLILKTDLVGQSWTVDVIKGGTVVTTLHPSYATGYEINGFDLSGYSTDIELAIRVEGTVSSESAGSTISAIMLSETGTSGSGLRSYTSPAQKVYDTGNLAGNLQTLIDGITSLDATINEYVAAGYDCSAAKANLETARSKYQAAVSAGTEQGITAFSNYEAGIAALDKAKQSLAYVSLSMILTYTSQIDDIITQLYSNGWNTEAKLIDTKNTKIKSSYDSCLKSYQAGNVNMVELNNLRVETIDVYNEASTYLEDSQNPLGGLLGILPYILIGIGVIVVGVIVFFFIRRRRSSWDELG